MAKMPFFQFYPHDWLYDTRICTDAEKAVLIDLLCFMWNAPVRGRLEGVCFDIARMVGKGWEDFRPILYGLKAKNIVLVEENQGNVAIISRRQTREEKERMSGRIRQRRFSEKGGGDPEKWAAIRVKILLRDDYICAYCRRKANTVDHVLPRSLGGLETESNLVACCKRCNSQKGNRTLEDAEMSFYQGFSFTKHMANTKLTPDISEVRSQKSEVIKDKDIITVPAAPRSIFSKPTIEDVKSYCRERRNRVDVERWLAHYESNGWKVGKNPMKDWRAAIRTWERSDFVSPSPAHQAPLNQPPMPAAPLISEEEAQWRKEMEEKRKEWNRRQKNGEVRPGEQPPWLPPFAPLRLKTSVEGPATPNR